jgi:hypothetical protein
LAAKGSDPVRDIGKTDLQQNTDAVRDRSGVRDSGEPEF